MDALPTSLCWGVGGASPSHGLESRSIPLTTYMKKNHRLGITSRVWSSYLKNRMGFSAKSNRSLFSLLCIALKQDGFPKPDGVTERLWVRQHEDHIEYEFNKLRGVIGLVKPQDQRPKSVHENVSRDAFLETYEWRKVRMHALKKYGARCQCCGASPSDGAVMNVDHIKPRKLFPQLALDVDNLQVLCHECNHGKGNWDQTDWRPEEIEPEVKSFIRDIARNG
jgi:HNH endonuclease